MKRRKFFLHLEFERVAILINSAENFVEYVHGRSVCSGLEKRNYANLEEYNVSYPSYVVNFPNVPTYTLV